MASLNDSFEKRLYPDLLKWDTLELCNEKHMLNCARYICRVILEFNCVTKAYQRLASDKNESDKKYIELAKKIEKNENCNNCNILEQRFQSQKSKFKTITNLLEQIASEACNKNNDDKNKKSFEQVQDMFTQMECDYNLLPMNIKTAESESKRKVKLNESDNNENAINPLNIKTPQKKICLRNSGQKSDESDQIEESLFNQASPILKKGRGNKKTNETNRPTPMKNLSNKYKHEKDLSDMFDEVYIINNSSPVILNDSNDNINKTPVKLQDSTPNYSIGLLQSNVNSKSKKGVKDAALKQVRLTFTKSKAKLSLNVSQNSKFAGGLRNACDNANKEIVIKQEVDENSPQHDLGTNFDEVDVINESPSCLKKNPSKRLNYRHRNEDENKHETVEDEDATMYIPYIKEENHKLDAKVEECVKSKLKISPRKKAIEDVPKFIYKEDPIRKKDDKKKVPGWSCTKCKDFYEVAFKGNDEIIKKKIHECSKHRGRFNPERQNTPPGFWDMNMPPIDQDTEAFNKQNNRS